MRWSHGLVIVAAVTGTVWGDAAKFVRVVLPEDVNPVIRNIADLFARQVAQRSGANVRTTGEAPLRVELAIEPGLGVEGFRIADAPAGTIRIAGKDVLGLLAGVGKFLRTCRFDRGGFTPGSWRGMSVPTGSFRAIYAATHFMNFYEAAPEQEVQQYVQELGLWGCNTLIVHFPTWSFKGFDDPAAQRNLRQIRGMFAAAKAVGMRVGLVQCPNQGFASADKSIRATKFPDDWHRRGNFGVNCCPSMPVGREYLLKLYDDLFEQFKDSGLDYLVCWPYDEGGCGCAACWPWGAKGYLTISQDVTSRARKRFPQIRSILSTWMLDSPPAGEWEGLNQALVGTKPAFDAIMADSHTEFPRYPLEKGVPGGLTLTNFPEISMWGRSPWGGFGANPLPGRFQRLWEQTGGKVSGGMSYSEGIYEDINKAICLQFYWRPETKAEDTVREYIAFEYSPDAVEDLLQTVRLLETTWTARGPASIQAQELIKRSEAKLTPQALAGWRWRVLRLRTVIDAELVARKDKMEGPVLKEAFEELTRIYHAEKTHSMPVRPPQVR